MNKKITLFLLALITGGAIFAQNVGVGTANPLEKLHVAGGGTVRVDGMASAGAFNGIPLTANDRMVWVDNLGTLHSLNNGGNGQILGINGSGVPVWINPATPSSLTTGTIWIGDASNAPVEHPLSGDVTMDMNGLTTIQDDAVDGTDITIAGEANGSIMYFDGTNWVNLGIGTAGQVLVTSGAGIPSWINSNAALATNDVVNAAGGAVVVTNGTGQVVGGTNLELDVQTNTVAQKGLVTAPTAGNTFKVWGTDGAGNPDWRDPATLLAANAKDITTANPSITITNGVGQTIGAANVSIDVANNALNVGGLVAAPTGANANQVWGTDASGNPAWVLPSTVLAANASDVTTANPAITIGNGTNQVIGAADMTIDVATNTAASAGLVTAGSGNNNEVWGTDGAGNPDWRDPATILAANAKDITTANPSITITNGVGQTIGAANVTIDVAANSAVNAGLVSPGGANPNQVWGTNGAGVPSWMSANSTIAAQNVTGTSPITITNGTGQVIGASAMNVAVATNALGQDGVVTGPTAFNSNQVWGTNGLGVPSWMSVTSTVSVDNGLYYNGVAGKIRQGGALVEATTITEGNFNYLHNLTGTGAFEVRNNATAGNGLYVNNTDRVGIGTAAPSEKLHIGGVANTARIEGVGTGGAHLTAPTAATDRMMYTTSTGVVKAMPNGANGSFLTVGPTGIPGWSGINLLVDNGLYYNAIAGKIRQGGPLVENTTITGVTFNYTHDLTSTGDFIVTEASNATPSLFVKGNDAATTDGFVGIGTNAPANRLHVNHNAATVATAPANYPFAVGFSNGAVDYTIGSNATFGLEQTWNGKPLLINSQGNFVGINLGTAPIQNLDVNGRMNVNNGVIQRGPTQINVTNDLGLYSQVAGNWIRIAANASPIKFFTDQGGGNAAGTNAIMSLENANGGSVSIAAETSGAGNAGTPTASAAVDISSVTKGILFPRMTQGQRNAIVGPVQGLHVYNTTTNCLNYWNVPAAGCGSTGYWDSYCCPVVNICISSSGNCLDLYAMAGAIAVPRCINIIINAGVTIGGCNGGGGCGAGAALNCSGFPSGTQITITNNGVIKGKGGNGGNGSRESDGVCAGDINPNGGQCGGDAILGGAGILINVINNGTVAGGGGGGGGGAFGCCSAGGGGGGGAGIPGGIGGAGQCWSCVSGFVCGCNRNGCSGGGGTGSAVGGAAGGGNGNTGAGTGCPGTCTSAGGTNGAAGGGLGANGGGAGAGGGATGASFRLNGCAAGSGMAGGTIQGPII